MDRKVYHVVPSGARWQVKHEGEVLSYHATKDMAVEAGRKVAKANAPSQLVVHKLDGTFDYEYTYELDPYPPRG